MAFILLLETIIAKTPAEYLTEYFESLKSKGSAESIDMFHPDEYARFATIIRGGLADDLKKNGTASRLNVFADPKDANKLAQMTDKEITKKFFKYLEDRNSGIREMNLNQKVKIIGSVGEKESGIEFVVVRIVIEAPPRAENVEVFSMRKKDTGEWGMLISGLWLDLGKAFGRH